MTRKTLGCNYLSLLHIAVILPFAAGIVLALLHRLLHKIHLGWLYLRYRHRCSFTLRARFLPCPSVTWYPDRFLDSVPGHRIQPVFRRTEFAVNAADQRNRRACRLLFYFYMSKTEALNRFYLYLLMFMGAMLGVVLSDNMIVLYGFWELTSITSFLLIAFHYKRKASTSGAQKSFLITVLADSPCLPDLC